VELAPCDYEVLPNPPSKLNALNHPAPLERPGWMAIDLEESPA
jgi:hypothetical protein